MILDSMSGSGTTLDVAKSLNRKCLAFDINPQRSDIKKYFTISEDSRIDSCLTEAKDWEDVIDENTGNEAVVEIDKMSFLTALNR